MPRVAFIPFVRFRCARAILDRDQMAACSRVELTLSDETKGFFGREDQHLMRVGTDLAPNDSTVGSVWRRMLFMVLGWLVVLRCGLARWLELSLESNTKNQDCTIVRWLGKVHTAVKAQLQS